MSKKFAVEKEKKPDEIEVIETTTLFTYSKRSGVIVRINSASYVLWDRRYRNQAHMRRNQNGE
jgi:hypothetical protein